MNAHGGSLNTQKRTIMLRPVQLMLVVIVMLMMGMKRITVGGVDFEVVIRD